MTNRELQDKVKMLIAEGIDKDQTIKELTEKLNIKDNDFNNLFNQLDENIEAYSKLKEENKILSDLAEKQVSIEQPKSIVKKHIVRSKHITLNK